MPLGLEAARHADRLLGRRDRAGRRRAGRRTSSRCPDRLRDDEPAALRRDGDAGTGGLRAEGLDPRRAARPTLTEPFLDAIDRLLRELNRSRG